MLNKPRRFDVAAGGEHLPEFEGSQRGALPQILVLQRQSQRDSPEKRIADQKSVRPIHSQQEALYHFGRGYGDRKESRSLGVDEAGGRDLCRVNDDDRRHDH